MVWSRQEFGDAYAYKPVFETKRTEKQQLYEVIVENQKGEIETYLTTSEHPFYIDGLGWLKASLLEAGMRLLDANGNSDSLRVRSQTKLTRWETVYNFEVEEFSTYHVGEFGVWVHNADCLKVTKENLQKQYGELDESYFGANGEIYWLNPLNNQIIQINKIQVVNGKQSVMNPLTGKWEDATKVNVSVDHILPQNFFTSDPRFKKLPKNVQDSLMNSPENLQPMLSSANSSKKNKIELTGNGWNTWKGHKIDANYKSYLFGIQEKIRQKLNDAYTKYGIK